MVAPSLGILGLIPISAVISRYIYQLIGQFILWKLVQETTSWGNTEWLKLLILHSLYTLWLSLEPTLPLLHYFIRFKKYLLYIYNKIKVLFKKKTWSSHSFCVLFFLTIAVAKLNIKKYMVY